MKTLAEYQQIVKDELQKQFFDRNSEPRELFEPIDYILAIGGKRLRPALCLLACNLFAEDIQTAIKPAEEENLRFMNSGMKIRRFSLAMPC